MGIVFTHDKFPENQYKLLFPDLVVFCEKILLERFYFS